MSSNVPAVLLSVCADFKWGILEHSLGTRYVVTLLKPVRKRGCAGSAEEGVSNL
jgi:hypothetical protein